MNLECPELASERAEVEARFLASAVSRDAADLTITIRCRDGIAELEVSVGARDQRRGVSFASEIAREAILTNLDRALSELVPSEATPQSMRASLPEPIARPSAATPARAQAPVIAPTPPPPKPPVAAPCVRNSTPNRVRAEAALESWGSTLALAGAAGLEQGVDALSFAVLAGGAQPLSAPPSFSAAEWFAAVEVGWEPPRGPGVRLASRLGVSLLSIEPASGFAASPTAVRTAAFLELDVQRPIWFGAIGVAPGVGVRVFSAPRTVNVDGEQALRLAAPTPRVTVALLLQTN